MTEATRACPYCGDPLTSARRVQCGAPDCKRAYNAARARRWHRSFASAEGQRYASKYRERELEYDQRRRQAEPHWRTRYPESASLADARRRLLLEQAQTAEAINPRDVHTRDAWTCQLCLLPIDPDVAWPDPMSASVDHVVPLARGGEHNMANVQSAHLGCNARKGARVAAHEVHLDGDSLTDPVSHHQGG